MVAKGRKGSQNKEVIKSCNLKLRLTRRWGVSFAKSVGVI
jgi:hypothetical protein